MSTMQLEGSYKKKPEIGQGEYHLVQLTGPSMIHLAALIQSHIEDSEVWQVDIGQGHIRFETAASGHFTAEVSGGGGVLLRSSRNDLEQLASRLQEMACAKSDPNDLIHLHLESYFTETGKGLSDVVLERLDDYHPS